jgi:hypothetical protein
VYEEKTTKKRRSPMSYHAPCSYRITAENQDVVVRFNRDMVAWDAMTKFLDYIELESLRTRSELTKKQAAAFAEEIDRDAWEHIKHKFIRE